jgi:hypothetical protein
MTGWVVWGVMGPASFAIAFLGTLDVLHLVGAS